MPFQQLDDPVKRLAQDVNHGFSQFAGMLDVRLDQLSQGIEDASLSATQSRSDPPSYATELIGLVGDKDAQLTRLRDAMTALEVITVRQLWVKKI